jgi:hypothetical protein
MKIIYRPSGFGKTMELIRLASEEPYGLIVCHSIDEIVRIWDVALKMKEDKEIENLLPFPISYRDFLEKRFYEKNVSKIFIDNIDMFIQSLTSVEIGAITLTREE